jgi:hypothetical protein
VSEAEHQIWRSSGARRRASAMSGSKSVMGRKKDEG